MTNKLPKGVGVALVTPFDANLNIDFSAYKRLLEHTAQIGVDYWVVQGTTGESPTTTSVEKAQLLAFAKENNPKKLPIVYGMGGNNTETIIQNIKNADLEGVTALLSVSPYYNKPSQRGIIAHYQKIADASPVPIVLYNVPGRTGSNITAETTLALAEHPNIIATKEASGNLIQCMEIAKNKPKDFMLISGDDMLTVPMISFGADGVISVMANAFQEFNDMSHLALEKNFEAASQKLFSLLALNDLMYVEGNPVGIKKVLEFQGVCSANVRLPLVEASDKLSEQIKKGLDELKK
ncbi:MAG: 4-hydroxy-tetrahydrodipicolinate synthase [Raineya sp.]|jgi:4-hydroxy-tetrahydrodipicolinate synthase|nr:4-hydroxy-tetrahydrodipicolinate synthase [Raineya sp.]